MPSLPTQQAFRYEDDGFGDLWELPGHGWHENLLKPNRWPPARLTLWPPPIPEGVPNDYVHTPEQEAQVHEVFLRAAVERKLAFVSLIWHPWSLGDFDPEMRMLRLVFDRVREMPLAPCTYHQLWQQCAAKA